MNDAPVCEVDATVRKTPNFGVVRHHQDRVSVGMQFAQKLNHGFGILFVEVSCGLVRKNQFRMIDQRSRYRHALLFAAGEP